MKINFYSFILFHFLSLQNSNLFRLGKGLTVCVSVLGGDFPRRAGESLTAKQNLRKCMDEEKVKGFVDVLVSHNIADGLSHL